MEAPRLKLALIGLGRLGIIRARILAYQQPRIELVAACDTKPGAEAAMVELPPTVKFFADPEDCMRNSGAAAVLISTATATHAPLICLGLDLGLHVMCEKPIATSLIATEEVIAKAAANPHLRFLVPFTRRYDESHRATKMMQTTGQLGNVHAVEATVVDVQDPNAFFVSFSALSGGIFLDCGIHSIDVGRYFLSPDQGLNNPRKQVRRVFATGQQAVYGDLAKYGDADNGWGIVEFENGKVLSTYVGRTTRNGFESVTKVFGTKSNAVINPDSALNRVQIRDDYGVRTASCQDAFTLFDKTFIADLAEFANSILDGTPLTCLPDDAYEAQKIAVALQQSFRIGEPIYFDDDGRPIMEPVRSAPPQTLKTVNAPMEAPTKVYTNGHTNGVTNGHSNGITSGMVNGH